MYIRPAAWLLILWMLQVPGALAESTGRQPFTWNQDLLWAGLEQRFVKARSHSCDELQAAVTAELDGLEGLIQQVVGRSLAPDDPLWDDVEARMLSAAPLLAACSDQTSRYIDAVHRLKQSVKIQAAAWPAHSTVVRQRLYRLIYGGRSAIEEILLQVQADSRSGITLEAVAASAAPAVIVRGVTLHSGDILVSRGGAATSALIARGNDYPGNFSHAALLFVDAETGEPVVLEALIETGVVVSSLTHYLEDKKLRIMVLRLRSDLEPMRRNPLLAHAAARWANGLIRRGHVAYDFEMDYLDHRKLFCAEVVYAAYEHMGIELWTGLSHISAPGTARWLAAFGVSHFVTLEPSDLEYDPQLTVVAEWHDPDMLFKDHVDNAVTDAMLEKANAGDPIKYNPLLLPVAGALKVYSWMKNSWGAVGPVPEGMGAAAALRNRWYTREHGRRAGDLLKRAEAFRAEKGYTPPYWELVRMARALR
jgi:hypothetical protein